jgi:class 3 adenylate cyclase
VLDSVGSKRAAFLGMSEGGTQCALFAAAYPERTRALVLYGAVATNKWRPETPWAPTDELFETYMAAIEQEWGGPVALELFAPSLAGDERVREWWARLLRLAASPATAIAHLRMLRDIDIRHVLPSIRVPTLVLQRAEDLVVNVENGRYLARHIPAARYVELSGNDHFPFAGDADAVLDEIREFLTGARHAPHPDRVLATVMFTDIVGSTERAAELGDSRWRHLLDRHHAVVRRELERFRGREVDTSGDGFFATFDGPARGIRCACAIHDAVKSLGLSVRTGLHTGECEMMADKVGGIAVHTGARVASMATPGEVLVSSTVKDLVAGSGLRFADRGVHALKGVPGEWRLFAVER